MVTPQGWNSHSVDTGKQPVSILTRDDADRVIAVPARPLLVYDAVGRPKLSLTLVLTQCPPVDAPSVAPFISQGLLAFTVTLALPDVASTMMDDAGKPIQPLFARAAEFALRSDETQLQGVEAFGPGPTAAFSLTLGREDSLEALSAIRGSSTRLSLTCSLDYLISERVRYLRVRGQYGAIYARLVQEDRRPLDRLTLERLIATMVFDGTIAVESEPEAASTQTITAAFLKVSSPVLQRVTAPDGERFSPRRPPTGQTLDVSLKSDGGGRHDTLELTSGLDELFRGCMEGQDSSAFIHLVAPDETGTWAPLPKRWVQSGDRETRGPRAPGAANLARIGTSAVALSSVARPNAVVSVSAHSLMADTTVHATKLDGSKIHYWAMDNLSLTAVGAMQPAERSLPVVVDPAAPLWTDRVDTNLHWYAPVLTAALPAPNTALDSSSFLFAFHTAGHTSSGAVGLEGTIRFRLQSGMSAQTQASWEAAGRAAAKPVPMNGLSVALVVPFRDQAGAARTQTFPATLTFEGDSVIAEVALIDDWLRLTYGALSTAGFQTNPAALNVAYTFEAYVPLNEDNLSLLFDRKLALTQIVRSSAAEKPEAGYFDAEKMAYRTPLGAIQFAQEASIPKGQGRGAVPRAPAAALSGRLQASSFAIRPELVHSSAVAELLQRRRYGMQSLGRDASQTVLYPCATLGAFYVQDEVETGRVAIGCRDALKLGQTEFRQYDRVEQLDDADFTVWRSLQQPGHFLLVPARWSIARFAADDPERAYRPAILVYSTLDAEVPANNRCAMLASLIPDVSPAKQRALKRSLAALAQVPVLRLVNEIEAELEYAWPLPANSGMDARVAKLFDAFQVTIGTGIDNVPQLQALLRMSGLTGTVHYRLPDGSSLESSLVLDLNHIVGPNPDGPVVVALQAQQATLTNRIERTVDVSDLVVELSDGDVKTVRMDQRLEPGAAFESPLPADVVRATPVITLAPGDAATLTEIRSFVEDVHTNIAFINLVNYANHGLAKLSLQARLRGVPGTQTLALDENAPVDSLDFVLPLTTYLANPVLEFAVTKTSGDDTTATTDWLAWALAERGNVVSLTWELIQ